MDNSNRVLPHPDLRPSCPEPVFSFLNPYTDEKYLASSHVAIYWEGGPETPQRVDISLISVNPFVVAHGIVSNYENTAKPGVYHWVIPDDLSSINALPDRDYRIYVENVERTNWHYSGVFRMYPIQAAGQK